MDNWKRKFEVRILARGKAYFDEKRVKEIKSSAAGKTAEYKAKVIGSEEYDVTITMDNGEIAGMSCTCPYHEDRGELCKHMAAVLFQLEAQGVIPYIDEFYTGEEILSELKKELLAGLLAEGLAEGPAGGHAGGLAEGLAEGPAGGHAGSRVTEAQIGEAIKSWQEDYMVTVEDGRKEMLSAVYGSASDEMLSGAERRAGDEMLSGAGRRAGDEMLSGAGRRAGDEMLSGAERRAGDEQESLEKLLGDLDNLVGLDVVKKDIRTLINFVRVNKVRRDRGLKTAAISYHLVFSGNPGTGKTTVARLLAKIYKQIGVLPEGHLVEVDRSGLIGGYLGQTAIKTSEVVESAIGGVLFIDEAYSLVQDEQDSYGKECIATILKAMEDHRDELIVIVAGYDELMHKFIDSNPGLRSRFNKYFHFPDYSGAEMEKIFLLQCKSNGYQLDKDAQSMLREHFEMLYENRGDNFGNGRDVRNIFEKAINAQADRLAEDADLTDDELIVLTAEDVRSVIAEGK